MGHGHHHHHHHIDISSEDGEKKLWWAVAANMLLTLAQVMGGIVSGSLSLIADALHNFSDAASLVIAVIAIRIGRRPADQLNTFGYKRAETVAALINLTTLILIGLFLCYEAILRFISPEPIEGWLVVIVAGIALAVDLFTVVLTYKGSKSSMNIHAAFLHNLTDAMASVGVILTGTLIILFGWVWMDAAMTLLIAGYILYFGLKEMPRVIHLLMEGAPENIIVADVIESMQEHKHVQNIHHVHIWRLDEHRNALEAHVVIASAEQMDNIKKSLKEMLYDEYDIEHSTLEFELKNCEA